MNLLLLYTFIHFYTSIKNNNFAINFINVDSTILYYYYL